MYYAYTREGVHAASGNFSCLVFAGVRDASGAKCRFIPALFPAPPPLSLSLSLARARARASLNVSCCSRIDAFALNERVKGILESIASLIASLFFFCVYTSFTRQI